MYKLLNENQNKNTLKDEYEKLLLSTNSTKKLSKEDSSLLLYEEFNKDIINYITSNIIKMDELSKNQKNKIDLNLYLKAFIDKLINILDMNSIITNTSEFYNLLYINLSSLILEDENEYKFCYVLFFKMYLSYLNDNKENYIYYKDKINKISQIINQLNLAIQEINEYSDNSNILYKKLFIAFTKDFLPNFINIFIDSVIKKDNNICLFDLIIFLY